jgi:hypothetical protein
MPGGRFIGDLLRARARREGREPGPLLRLRPMFGSGRGRASSGKSAKAPRDESQG